MGRSLRSCGKLNPNGSGDFLFFILFFHHRDTYMSINLLAGHRPGLYASSWQVLTCWVCVPVPLRLSQLARFLWSVEATDIKLRTGYAWGKCVRMRMYALCQGSVPLYAGEPVGGGTCICTLQFPTPSSLQVKLPPANIVRHQLPNSHGNLHLAEVAQARQEWTPSLPALAAVATPCFHSPSSRPPPR